MGRGKNRSGGFLCFNIADREDAADVRGSGGGLLQEESRVPRRRLYGRILRLIFSPWKRKEKERKEPMRCLLRKDSGLSNAKMTDLCSSRSASALSFSSSSSRLSMAAVAAFPTKRGLGVMKSEGMATRILLLVASLSLTVFWGRMCAIMWTSSWLFIVACRYAVDGETAAVKEAREWPLLAEFRRRRGVTVVEEKRTVGSFWRPIGKEIKD